MTKRHGLYFASGKECVREHRLREPDKTKYEIYNAIRGALPDCRSWGDLAQRLERQGIGLEFKYKGSTDIREGVRFTKGAYTFWGSKIDQRFSYSKLDAHFGRAQKQDAPKYSQQARGELQKAANGFLSAFAGLFGGGGNARPRRGTKTQTTTSQTSENEILTMKNGQATLQEGSTLALVYAEVKKLTKHFRLDRHPKNAPDDPAATEPTDGLSEADRQTLREILERVNELAKTSDRKDFMPEQDVALKCIENTVGKALRDFHNAEFRELKTAIERLEKAVGEIKPSKSHDKIFHYHQLAIDIIDNRIVFLLVLLALLLFGSLAANVAQYIDNEKFRDNDLRYRYIEMRNGIGPKELIQLRDVFEFNRVPEVIKKLHKTVGDYERHVRQQTENAARARFNASEAERLKKQAEAVKKGKWPLPAYRKGTTHGGAAQGYINASRPCTKPPRVIC